MCFYVLLLGLQCKTKNAQVLIVNCLERGMLSQEGEYSHCNWLYFSTLIILPVFNSQSGNDAHQCTGWFINIPIEREFDYHCTVQ